jgi:hypothetical protein
MLSQKNTIPYVLSIAAASATAVLLTLQGRILWCKVGDHRIYVNEAWNSPHTSQHFFDPYSFTHVLHGVAFFWLLTLVADRLSVHSQFLFAIILESAWEMFENTSYVIEKYRANTISVDYFGDSVMNSLGDIASCATGFVIASRLGSMWSLVFFVLVEMLLLVFIHDSLLLNIIMLIYPFDSVKHWQTGV